MLAPNKFNGYRADGVRLYEMRKKFMGFMARDRALDTPTLIDRTCSVVTAVVGSAVVGAAASKSASKKAAASNDKATQAAADATAERLAFDERVYDEGKADRAFASDMARRMAGWQEEDRNKYNALQDEQVARGRKFQAAEDQMLVDAQDWDTPERREAAAGKAMVDVNAGFDAAHGQAVRAQQRMGVNPNSGNALALESQIRLKQAAGLASAANSARNLVETQGYARKMDAIGLGKGLVGNQATQAGLQLDAGREAVKNSLVPISVASEANSAMSQGYGNAATGFGLIAGLRADNFYGAQNYGMRVGNATGAMFGDIFTKTNGFGLGGGAPLGYENPQLGLSGLGGLQDGAGLGTLGVRLG